MVSIALGFDVVGKLQFNRNQVNVFLFAVFFLIHANKSNIAGVLTAYVQRKTAIKCKLQNRILIT
jgi:hypothetical protein